MWSRRKSLAARRIDAMFGRAVHDFYEHIHVQPEPSDNSAKPSTPKVTPTQEKP